MPNLRIASIAACLMLCAGCSPAPTIRSAEPVTITHTRYIALPDALTAPCAAPTPAASIGTWGDLADAYARDAGALKGCAAKVDAIRGIQPASSVGIP